MAPVSSLFSRWRLFLRTVAMAVGLSVTVFVGVPAAASAQLPKTYQSPAKFFQTQTAPRACTVGNLKTQCFTVMTYSESVHSVLPSTNPLLTRLAGSAAACGTYSVTQSASWTDWATIPFPPYVLTATRVTLRASAGYNNCGGSWTNWITPTCTVYLPSFECAGYTGVCGSTPCGGNYKDPSHSYWNTEWYNQPIREYCGPYICSSWTVYIRLWNNGYGSTSQWAGES